MTHWVWKSWFGAPAPVVCVSLRQAARNYKEDKCFKMKCSNHPRWEENINYIFEGAVIEFYFSPFDSYSSYRVNITSTSFIQSV